MEVMNSLCCKIFLSGVILVAKGCFANVNEIFVYKPLPYNASLREIVQFNCSTSEPGIVYWQVNGAELHDASNRNRQIATNTVGTRSSFTIVALAINDNIQITCLVTTRTETLQTEPATLRVQGILRAPTNFTAYSMNNSVHLSWEAPPTINLTSTEPDILYYVISLHIAHSGQNITVVVNTTEYIHEPNTDEWPWGLSLCDEVRFRVSAVNVVGEGNASDIVTGSYHREPILSRSRVDPMTYSCTAQCSDSIIWSIADPQSGQEMLDQRVMVRSSNKPCSVNSTGASGTFSETFEVPDIPDLNGANIQCIAIQLLHNSRPVVCFSEQNILDIPSNALPEVSTHTQNVMSEPHVIHNNPVKEDPANSLTYTHLYIVASAGGLCLLLFLVTAVMLTVVSVLLCKRKTRQFNLKNTKGNDINGTYDSPNEYIGTSRDDLNSTYSIPLPTDPCPAYDTVPQKTGL